MQQAQEHVNWNERTHHAVRAGIAYVLFFLSSSDPQLCESALHLLGCFKEERALIVPHLRTLLETTNHKVIAALTLRCLGALLTPTDEAVSLLLPYLAADHPEGLRLSAAIALCEVMKEHISEEMIEWIEQAEISPHALLRSRDPEADHHVEWLINQPKYVLALMSVVTCENHFIPQPIRIPAEYQNLFANAPGFFPFMKNKEVHYPAWFDHFYVEEAAVMLLRFCFPEDSILVQTAFVDLNERQQCLLRMLAEHKIFWPDERPYRMMEEHRKRYQQFPEELRASLSHFSFTRSQSYEEELDASEMVQLLRGVGVPDTQQALQRFVSD